MFPEWLPDSRTSGDAGDAAEGYVLAQISPRWMQINRSSGCVSVDERMV
jgi:hypothetical protein